MEERGEEREDRGEMERGNGEEKWRGEMERGKGGKVRANVLGHVSFTNQSNEIPIFTLCVGPAVSPVAAMCHRSHQMPAARTQPVSRHGHTHDHSSPQLR